jgi:phage regulator Rha-like protein
MANLTTMPNYKPEDNLEIAVNPNGELLVDSRLVAAKLGRDHNDWITSTIMKYKKPCEENFGLLRFENVVNQGVTRGNPAKFVWLNEDQSIFFLMNSRNNGNVLACKIALVKKFSEARTRIAELERAQLAEQAVPKLILNPETLEPTYGQNLESQIVNKIAIKASKATKLSQLSELLMLAEGFNDLLAQL